ncbi:tetratricopeptide repeat protein [Microbacterium sp. I2]|uniref:tetratricopeptide repeat protein n=1 Tax=Microbacterium sp. I2 TaxID=3391826 RepID=UPI003ED9A7DD
MVALATVEGATSGLTFSMNPFEWTGGTFAVGFFLVVDAGILALGIADYRWVGDDLDRRLRASVVHVAATAIARHKAGEAAAALSFLEEVTRRTPSWPWAHAFRAHALMGLGRYEEAMDSATRAISLDSDNPWWRILRAEICVAAEWYTEALEELDRSNSVPLSAVAVNPLRGAALYGLGRRAEALEAFDRAIDLSPTDPLRRMERGRALLGFQDGTGHDLSPSEVLIDMLLDDGDRVALQAVTAMGRSRLRARDAESALADFDFVIEKKAGNAEAHLWRAAARYQLGDTEGAEEDFACALDLGVPRRRVHLRRADALRRSGQNLAAASEYSAAIEFESTANAHLARAFIRQRLDDVIGASEDFARVIDLRPDHADAMAHLAETLADLDRTEESEDVFAQAIGLGTSVVHTYWVWISTLLRTGRGAEAEPVLALALASAVDDEDRSRLLALAGSVYAQLRLFRKALDALDEADRMQPDSPEVSYRRGLCLRAMGDIPAAIDAFYVAIDRPWANQFAALASRSALYRSIGRLDESLADISAAIRREPEDVRLRVSRGCLNTERGDLDIALADLDMALQIDPTNVSALGHRLQARNMLGDTDGAAADLDTLSQALGPDDPKVLHARASALFSTEDWEGAAQLYRRILVNDDDAGILFNLGAAYVNNSQFEEAEQVFQVLVRRRESVADRAGLALSVSLQGRSEEAVAMFRRLRNDNSLEIEHWMTTLKPEVLPNYDRVMADWHESDDPPGRQTD